MTSQVERENNYAVHLEPIKTVLFKIMLLLNTIEIAEMNTNTDLWEIYNIGLYF